MTRRQFIAGAAALGVSAGTLGMLLGACGSERTPTGAPSTTAGSPLATPQPVFRSTPPVIDPLPTTATYGDMLGAGALVPTDSLSDALRGLVDDVAADAGIPVVAAVEDGRRQARLRITADDPSFAAQAYHLEVVPTSDGPDVTIRAGDEAGAFYGLVSLTRLIVTDGSTCWMRAAVVDDAPGFARRGAILDPFVLPDIGVTAASRALLLERVRLGVRYKLNLVDLPARAPWPELVRYCEAHHVEVMAAVGYQNVLTTWSRDEARARVDEMVDAGARSIALCWDDISTRDPDTLASRHAAVFGDLYGYLRGRDPGIRLSAVLPPYGGIPGQNLVFSEPGDGERYLAVMHDALPADVRVFWTGDGGVFSDRVTTAGAKAYADAVGHEIGLWDNNSIGFSRDRRPCSGRAPDLSTVVRTYMGNLAGESNWQETGGEVALLTSLFYTWNPAIYDPASAAVAAERSIGQGS